LGQKRFARIEVGTCFALGGGGREDMSHSRVALIAVVTLAPLLVGRPAAAQDPLFVGETGIGQHPWYSSIYSGFWRKDSDYTVLTDGTSTFINAPSPNGTIYFRAANTGSNFADAMMSLYQNDLYLGGSIYAEGIQTRGGVESVGILTSRAQIQASNVETANTDVIVANSSGSGHAVSASSTGGYGVYAFSLNNYAGYFGGSELGLLVEGATTALRVNGTVTTSSDLDIGGTARKPGGGPWSSTSDVRVKRDVASFNQGLAELEKIRPVTFRYNGLGGTEDTGQQFVGVIAQEVEQVFPFMVSSVTKNLRPADRQPTSIKQVDGNAFTYALINAVRELAEQNREMKEIICRDHAQAPLCRRGSRPPAP
jgi:hypothetical protein